MRLRLLTFLSVITITISAAFLLPYTIDLDAQRDQIAKQISRDTGMDVTLQGPIGLRILPKPALKFENVLTTKSERSTGQNISLVIAAGTVEMGVSLLALLDGELKVRDVALGQAKVRVVGLEDASGIMRALRLFPAPVVMFSDLQLVLTQSEGAALRFDHLNGKISADATDGPFRITLNRQGRGIQPLSLDARIGSFVTNRLPLRLVARAGTSSVVKFNGFLNQRPNAMVEGEVSIIDRRLLPEFLAKMALQTAHLPSQAASMNGLIQITQTGFFADNLEIGGLNTKFQSQLRGLWPKVKGRAVQVSARLSADEIDLDLIQPFPSINASPAALTSGPITPPMERADEQHDQLASLLPAIDIDARVLAGRFSLGEEVGRNLVIDFATLKKGIRLNRLSADLPFNSSILAAAEITGLGRAVRLSGDMAVRSSDSLAALLWLGTQFGYDLSFVAETVDEPSVQRTGLVTEFAVGPEAIRLTGLAGRIGDEQIELDLMMSRTEALSGHLDLRLSQANLAILGLMEDMKLSRQSPFFPLDLPVRKWLETVLNPTRDIRDFSFTLRSNDVRAEDIKLGPMVVSGRIAGDRLDLRRLQFENYLDSRVALTGTLHHDGQAVDGSLDVTLDTLDASQILAPLKTGLKPFFFDISGPLALTSTWLLTARDHPDWPNAIITGSGRAGELKVDFDMRTPVRDFVLDAAGTRFELALKGSGSELSARLGLPIPRTSDEEAVLSLSSDAQPGSVSVLEAGLTLNDDQFSLSGAMRPGPTGRRVEGRLIGSGANILPYLGLVRDTGDGVAFDGDAQIVLRQDGISFSNIDLGLGAGRLTGEGAVDFTALRSNLTANMLIDALDLDPFLPHFSSQTGWSENEIAWGMLGASDANLQIRLANAAFLGLPIDDLRANIRLVEGVLEAPDIIADFLGGQVEFDLQAEGGELTPSFTAAGNFTTLQPEALLTLAYDRAIIRAPMSGNFALQGRGKSTRDIFASLAGAAQVEVLEGSFNLFNMRQLRNAVANSEGGSQNVVPEALFWQGQEYFNRGLGVFTFRDGRLETSAAELLRSNDRVLGKIGGQFDFVERWVSARAQFYDAAGSDMLTIDMSDTIDAPAFNVLWSAALQ